MMSRPSRPVTGRAVPAKRIWRVVRPMAAVLLAGLLLAGAGAASLAAEAKRIAIGYIGQPQELPPKLSNLDLPPGDEGTAGGELSIKDNNRSTGKQMVRVFGRISACGPFADQWEHCYETQFEEEFESLIGQL